MDIFIIVQGFIAFKAFSSIYYIYYNYCLS